MTTTNDPSFLGTPEDEAIAGKVYDKFPSFEAGNQTNRAACVKIIAEAMRGKMTIDKGEINRLEGIKIVREIDPYGDIRQELRNKLMDKFTESLDKKDAYWTDQMDKAGDISAQIVKDKIAQKDNRIGQIDLAFQIQEKQLVEANKRIEELEKELRAEYLNFDKSPTNIFPKPIVRTFCGKDINYWFDLEKQVADLKAEVDALLQGHAGDKGTVKQMAAQLAQAREALKKISNTEDLESREIAKEAIQSAKEVGLI